jgi:hypothetical protein
MLAFNHLNINHQLSYNKSSHRHYLNSMPLRTVTKPKSMPVLRRQLSLVHLAPIPEVPIRQPTNPAIAQIDFLLNLLDDILDESVNEYSKCYRYAPNPS